ncbi:sugar-binding domain-containing protein, partial [Clostridium perfringens]|uniref:sugar-binding domain-containing protein n=1 Tax=Clostridium perfringens TaxID=1502 RepID=UPI003A0FCE89
MAAENSKMKDATKKEEKTREILNFNNDWGFFRGDVEGAEGMEFDDSEFVNVTIPHTMRLEKKHNNTTNGVYKEIGWYRRYFTLDKSYEDKKLQLQFEGVMTDSDIYLNGEKVYTRNGGYIGFNVDITDKVKFGEDNVLAVRVSNVDNPNTPPGKPDSRLDFHYYGGIYRDVMLTVSEKTYITDSLEAEKVAGGGVFVKYS